MDRVGDPSAPREWRFIESGPGPGALNMGLDIAIQRAHSLGAVPPTLRLYTWRRPTLSLGRFQDAERGIDLKACAKLGIDVVRRPTGGRAILHTDDVTYSFVCRSEFLRGGKSVVASYKEISAPIRSALRILGLNADLARGDPGAGPHKMADCFASTSLADLAVGAMKVVGSAQCRHDGVVLQQGTIPLGPKPESFGHVFGAASEVVAAPFGGLSAAAGRSIETDEMTAALAAAFRDAVCGTLTPRRLTQRELDEATRMAEGLTIATARPCPSRAGAASLTPRRRAATII